MKRVAFAIVLFVALLPCPAASVTKLEGEYQLMLDARNSTVNDDASMILDDGILIVGGQRAFPWDWDTNNNDNWTGAQVRLFSQPRPNVEAFIKFEADFNTPGNAGLRPEFQYREAHARYRWDLRNRGFDSYLFSRQDRFWLDNYLLKIVENPDKQIFTDNAQGLRVESWGFFGVNAVVCASDFSGQFNPADGAPPEEILRTDDAYLARVRREFFRDKALRLGMTYNRKVETNVTNGADVKVLHADSRYRLRGVDLSLEYAESRSPIQDRDVRFSEALDSPITVFKHTTDLRLSDRSVVMAEIRTLSLGTPRLGYVNLVPQYWRRGPLYENRLGDLFRDESGTSRQRDNTGFNLNAWYLLPERAITVTSNYKRYASRGFEKREFKEFYHEIYVEFVNGFTGKTYLRQRDLRLPAGAGFGVEEHDDWFGELQVENRLAWMRIQSKVKDLGQASRKELVVLEARVNLTDKLKSYNRFGFANDPGLLRKGVFLQLQYRPTYNMEMFLEYGPSWIGDGSTPVDDFDLEGGGDQTDLVKFILKGWF